MWPLASAVRNRLVRAHPPAFSTFRACTAMADTAAHTTKIAPVAHLSADQLQQTVTEDILPALHSEQVIGVPTDTIYGLAALAQSDKAIAKIYAIKGRDENKPIAICVDSIPTMKQYGVITVTDELLAELLPGPVTLVFERTPLLNPLLNPKTSLIGIRIPDYPVIQHIARAAQQPLALTSANKSSEPSTLVVEEFQHLWPQLGVVVDGGRLCDSRAGSTVVDLSARGLYKIIREGSALSPTVATLHKHGITQAP
eukprot:m.102549 g.102549  ORF g.102549 m.102549 type:complete len:255 (+) comp51540_c1_seq1:171-935(+)